MISKYEARGALFFRALSGSLIRRSTTGDVVWQAIIPATASRGSGAVGVSFFWGYPHWWFQRQTQRNQVFHGPMAAGPRGTTTRKIRAKESGLDWVCPKWVSFCGVGTPFSVVTTILGCPPEAKTYPTGWIFGDGSRISRTWTDGRWIATRRCPTTSQITPSGRMETSAYSGLRAIQKPTRVFTGGSISDFGCGNSCTHGLQKDAFGAVTRSPFPEDPSKLCRLWATWYQFLCPGSA